MPREAHPASVPTPVILTKVRTQSHKGLSFGTLGPDFRQDDGACVVASDAHV